jgi:hypothetical protein
LLSIIQILLRKGEAIMIKSIFFISMLFAILTLCAQVENEPYYAADQSLLFMPTAYTMPQGTSALTDYEVVILQYSYAISNRAHLSAMSAFPVSKELLRSFTIGTKVNYLKSGMLQAAVWGSFTPDHAFRLVTFGNVFSYGTPKTSGHAAVGFGSNMTDKLSSAALMAGATTRLSKSLNFLGEITTSSEALKKDESFNGLLTVGIRFKGTKISWDLGGFRPLAGDDDGIFLLPYLKATFIF